MSYLMGIDLGTSSVKTIIMDYSGNVLSIAQKEYTFDIPQEGWAEQNPDVWWESTLDTIENAISKASIMAKEIKGIGFSGQMHGVVMLDASKKSIRPAIIWSDQRSANEVNYLNDKIGSKKLGEIACNKVATGFMIASLAWVKNNEKSNSEKIKHVILPKDYIRYKITGEIGTDISDAASTLAFDVNKGEWSSEIIGIAGLDISIFPEVNETCDIAGSVCDELQQKYGFSKETRVVFGGADQVMQAIGNGIVKPKQASVTLGTGGQLFVPLSSAVYDHQLRAHTFNNYKRGSWYFLGAALSSGLSLRWFRENVLSSVDYDEMSKYAKEKPAGSDGLLYLPYLSGERTPHMDTYARGMFFGLTLNHDKKSMIRAIMEGVVFSIKDCFSVLKEIGHSTKDSIIASGGGASSNTWLQIQADILEKEVYKSQMKEQAAVGAAIAAGVGAGIYSNIETACAELIVWSNEPVSPNEKNVAIYKEYYELYKDLYVSNKKNMKKCTELSRG